MASKFWLISAPPMPTAERAYEIVEEKTSRSGLSKNTKFVVPSLKVGTMDSLMSLSDDLVKVDNFVESTTRRIGANLLSILADGQAVKDDRPPNQILQINGASVETWVSRFQWIEAKYPVKNSCRELTEQIQGQVGRIEEELRVKAADYSNIVQSLHASERKRVGTLAVRDVADLIKPSDIHVSEYLTTLFVVVPKFSYREWESCYETLVSDRVVPRSSTLIYEDNDNGLWNVVLFKIVADEFRGKCRERKFTVREVNLEESNVDGSVAHQQLVDEKERQKNRLLLWCKANFSEAFIAWIHLKAIRVHVESILRYGLPPVYQAILMQPQPKQEKKLRTALSELFSHLTASMGSVAGDEDILGLATPEEFFPYVYLEVETDVTARTSV